jgi:competence protein ComEC
MFPSLWGLYWLFTRLGLTREKAALVILFALPSFALLARDEAPVIRSVLMAGLALWAIF